MCYVSYELDLKLIVNNSTLHFNKVLSYVIYVMPTTSDEQNDQRHHNNNYNIRKRKVNFNGFFGTRIFIYVTRPPYITPWRTATMNPPCNVSLRHALHCWAPLLLCTQKCLKRTLCRDDIHSNRNAFRTLTRFCLDL